MTLASTLDTFAELRVGVLATVFAQDGSEVVCGPIERIEQPREGQPGRIFLNPVDLAETAGFVLIDDDDRFAPGWYFLDLEDPADDERKPSMRGPVYELTFAFI